MSFRGRGGGGGGRGGGFRGGNRGGFNNRGGGRGGGRGGFGGRRFEDQGPPQEVVALGHFTHTSEDDLVCKCTNEKVPYFNAPVYLENKQQIGKVDEIFGPVMDFWFSVKLSENMNANSFSKNQQFYIDPYKLLPLQRFLAPQGGRVAKGAGRGGRGGRGGGFGGRGGGGRGGGFRGRGGFGGGGGRGFGGGRGGGRGGGGRGFRGGRGR